MDLRRSRSGIASTALHIRDVGGDFRRSPGGVLDVAGYLLRRRALLFHRRGNGRGNLRHAADGITDLPDRAYGFLRRGLDAADLLTDLTGRLRGLLGERLDLGRHNGKAATGLSRACRLDGGVERQQVGLPGDGIDQFHHVADARGSL